jgi:hypothetical protein
MARKLVDQKRSKAIVADSWDQVKTLSGASPNWPFIGLVAIVDAMLERNPKLDGRDIGDAIVLCWRMEETPTKARILANMKRVNKGREGVAGYR